MANTSTPDIVYTKVDEAPELAAASFLPIIRRFAGARASPWTPATSRWPGASSRRSPTI